MAIKYRRWNPELHILLFVLKDGIKYTKGEFFKRNNKKKDLSSCRLQCFYSVFRQPKKNIHPYKMVFFLACPLLLFNFLLLIDKGCFFLLCYMKIREYCLLIYLSTLWINIYINFLFFLKLFFFSLFYFIFFFYKLIIFQIKWTHLFN